MSGDKMFVVEWSDNWGQVIAVHPFKMWCERPVGERNFFSETVWARDEIDAYMQVTHKEQTND